MKLFVRKVVLFAIPVILIFYMKPFYMMLGEKYKNIVTGNEIYLSIKKSKEKSSKKTLIIGDSVGKQLFDNSDENSDYINSLACNQAIGVIGQYFLLNNYIKAGNEPQEIYMLYTPFSFTNNLDQVYTFHYFLKPFYKREYLTLFSEGAINQIDKIPYSSFCQEPYILTSNWAPDFQSNDGINCTFLSPISKEYLLKIKRLCAVNNIDFYIIPTPTKVSNKSKVLNIDKSEFSNSLVKKELNYFIDNIKYYPDSLYVDDVHLKDPQKLKSLMMDEIKKARTHNNTHKKFDIYH